MATSQRSPLKGANEKPVDLQAKPQVEPPDLKRKLAWRMGFAGLMIVMLLGTLALFDYLSAPDETEVSAPRFTQPVPVPRKEITQPVKPAEPVPPPAVETVIAEEKKAAEPEVSAAPVEPPPRPEVDSQPALSRPQTSVTPRTQPLSRPPFSGQPSRLTPPAGQAVQPRPVSEGVGRNDGKFDARPDGKTDLKTDAGVEAGLDKPKAVREPVAPAGGSTLGGRLFSGFALQAGVFSDPRLAEELHAKLTLNGIPSTIEARVQVGPFKTREAADAAREKMKTLGIDALMLMPPKGAVRR
jgi:DedD protein